MLSDEGFVTTEAQVAAAEIAQNQGQGQIAIISS